jgi:hypothetical protein
MSLIPFVTLFPKKGVDETRTITTRGHPLLPDDEYALVEFYCPDPTCDCRRAMLNVVPRRGVKRSFLASISFGFDRDDEMAGLFLDPLNPQSEYAEVFLDIVLRDILSDPDYVARLEAHYDQVKQAVANPTPPIRRVLRRLRAEEAMPASPKKTVGRNAPCPYGSGKKYKNCCMRKDRRRSKPMPKS